MKPCARMRDYLDRSFNEEETADFARHTLDCPQCSGVVSALNALDNELQDMMAQGTQDQSEWSHSTLDKLLKRAGKKKTPK